jgi:hypothetical protein
MDGSTVHFPARAPQKFRARSLNEMKKKKQNEKQKAKLFAITGGL